MTALRVVTDHDELENSGEVTHSELDGYINTTPWIVVSGALGPVPPDARRLKAGTGIALFDVGPGGDIVVTASPMSGTGVLTSWMEVPSGSNDGANRNFVLANVVVPTTALMFFVNGVLQAQGINSDYTLTSGTLIHVNYAYRSGSSLFATYPY